MKRKTLRYAAFTIALALVALWFRFLQATFAGSLGGVPAPGAFVVTVLFSGVAIAGGVAALRDVPVAVALTGFLSLVPVGLYLLLFPGATRWIGVLDAAMLAIGLVMLRSPDGAGDEVSPPPAAPPRLDSGPRSSP
jgi:hypothetical protein